MDIPDSINNLTETKKSSPITPDLKPGFNTEKFFECINDIVPIELRKYFDKGYNFYKLSNNSDLTFVKTIFYLYSDFYKDSLRQSNIDIEKQEAAIKSLDLVFKNIENNFDMFSGLLQNLKIDKKVFDINRIFMIIIGYAISNIRKFN